MTKVQRIGNLVLSLLMIVCGLIMLLNPQGGLLAVAYVLSVVFLLYGARKLVYYIRMARHMVGGLSLLFRAIIAIDVGIFAVAVVLDSPKLAIALYLIAYNALTGFLTIARGVESKLFRAPWVLNIVLGLVSLALAVLCIVFFNSDETLIWVFCIGLFCGAGMRLISAFKPTEIIYIQ